MSTYTKEECKSLVLKVMDQLGKETAVGLRNSYGKVAKIDDIEDPDAIDALAEACESALKHGQTPKVKVDEPAKVDREAEYTVDFNSIYSVYLQWTRDGRAGKLMDHAAVDAEPVEVVAEGCAEDFIKRLLEVQKG